MTTTNKIPRDKLTQSEVKRILNYCPKTGIFTWRVDRNPNALKGSRAGTKKPDNGYRQINIAGYFYYEHRLAIFYMTGKWPTREVDHKNHVVDDNRWTELQEATPSENGQNKRKPNRDGSSGLLGVYWSCSRQRWVAQLVLNKRKILCRFFTDKNQAYAAYLEAKVKHHPRQTLSTLCK